MFLTTEIGQLVFSSLSSNELFDPGFLTSKICQLQKHRFHLAKPAIDSWKKKTSMDFWKLLGITLTQSAIL